MAFNNMKKPKYFTNDLRPHSRNEMNSTHFRNQLKVTKKRTNHYT